VPEGWFIDGINYVNMSFPDAKVGSDGAYSIAITSLAIKKDM
jgi:hypothetical protein